MFTALRQSLKALTSNPARTVLTTIGIVIGIATVVLVLSAGEGFRGLINAEVGSWGTNTLFVETRVPATTKSRAAGAQSEGGSFNGVVVTSFKQRDLDQIKTLPGVLNAYGMVMGQAVASYKDVQKNALYYGAASERFEVDQHDLREGRFFSAAEDRGAAQVAILGSTLADNLFGQEEPIGKLIRYGNLNFEVIGVYEAQGGFAGPADESAYIPLATAQKKMLGIDYLAIGVVQVADINQADGIVEDIKALLRHNHNITDVAKDDFEVQTQAQALDTFNVIFSGITMLLIAIAAISLIVGGVGIMNIMYVVVTERTAEIGLKKALGATPGAILNEFLIEAVIVTVLGGIFGVALGSGLGWLVSIAATAAHLAWPFAVPTYAIFLAVGVSALIGIVFGVLPARNAARLNPIEALRYE